MKNQNNQATIVITKNDIAKANDLFRQTMIETPRHKILMTAGVIGSPHLQEVITQIRVFKKFTEGNDPHGEHDFGSVVVNREKFFWKLTITI